MTQSPNKKSHPESDLICQSNVGKFAILDAAVDKTYIWQEQLIPGDLNPHVKVNKAKAIRTNYLS